MQKIPHTRYSLLLWITSMYMYKSLNSCWSGLIKILVHKWWNQTGLVSCSVAMKFNYPRYYLHRCLMYLVNYWISTVVQNVKIPLTSCSLFFGLISRRKNFISCQRFSIGFRSGLSAGICIQLIPFSLRRLLRVQMYAWGHYLPWWTYDSFL